jgi:hypothetical protein
MFSFFFFFGSKELGSEEGCCRGGADSGAVILVV